MHAPGRYSPVRCGASNRCAYCAWLASRENVMVVGLDARRHAPPSVGLTLTTHRADFDMATFRTATRAVFQRLRRHYGGEVAYCGLMEWTTGRRTPGRRPHMHALVKGLRQEQADDAHALVRETWERATGGAWVVECRPLRTPAGAIAYMVGHHHKAEQAPPADWSGKRMRPSRGYFGEPIAQLREQARGILARDTAKAKLLLELAEQGVAPEDLEDQWDELLADAQSAPPPRLAKLQLRDGALVDVATGELLDA